LLQCCWRAQAQACTYLGLDCQKIEAYWANIWWTIPPKLYDHPYAGNLEMVRIAVEDIPEVCPNVRTTIGCTFPYLRENRCVVALIAPELAEQRMHLPYEIILRHELAHCSGWPADHHGGRALNAQEMEKILRGELLIDWLPSKEILSSVRHAHRSKP